MTDREALLTTLKDHDTPHEVEDLTRAYTVSYTSTVSYSAGDYKVRCTGEMKHVFNKDGSVRRIEFKGEPVT